MQVQLSVAKKTASGTTAVEDEHRECRAAAQAVERAVAARGAQG
jgi:hypothetical protein